LKTSAEVLEFESLLQLVGRYVASPMGRRELEKVEPHTGRERLIEDLAEAALAAAVLFGTDAVVWYHATSAEVFGLGAFFLALAFLLWLHVERTASRRHVYALAFVSGLAMCNQHTFLLFGGPMLENGGDGDNKEPAEEPERSQAASGLAHFLSTRGQQRMRDSLPPGALITTINGQPVAAHPMARFLMDAGFHPGPLGMALRRIPLGITHHETSTEGLQ